MPPPSKLIIYSERDSPVYSMVNKIIKRQEATVEKSLRVQGLDAVRMMALYLCVRDGEGMMWRIFYSTETMIN